MATIWQFLIDHQVLCTLAVGYTWSAFISALPAPQASSSTLYRFFFTFFNVLAANISRAQSTRVENSPNFAAAFNAQNAKAGTDKVVVEMNPVEPKP
jgi:hypothetical protein